MTKEEKQLVIIDLAGRLPYHNLKCKLDLKGYLEWNPEYKKKFDIAERVKPSLFDEMSNEEYIFYSIPTWDRVMFLNFEDYDYAVPVEFVKPILRPMSSMTKEERYVYHSYCDYYYGTYFDTVRSIDWLNEKGFDYRGLIEKGLAEEKK